jgi:fatty-acyl-CoA synthase
MQEVAIVGFPHERWGETPHALVVLKEGARADERELREFARAERASSS